MALVLADRVRDTTATTGTGTVTLSGTAPTGYQNFSVIGNGNTTYYTINSDTQWEVGVGTYTSSGTTLARNTVLASSNGGALVDFAAGTKDVFVTYPSEKAVTEDYGNALAATTAANLAGGAAGSIPYQTAANTTAMLATGTGVLIGGATPSYTMSPSLTQVTVAADPTTNFQVATKQYVDTQTSAGIHYHEPVRVESPINLNATYNNGTAGVGATLTNAGTQAALVVDGVTLSVADRVLIYEQTDETQNGIYVVTSVGSGSTNWVLTRSSDADTYVNASPDGLSEGSTVFVQQGTTGAGETYTCNTTGTIVFGTTAITFAQISSAQIYSAGTGLTLTGTTFSLTSPVATTLGGTGLTSFTTGGAVYATSSSTLTTGTLPATAGGTGQSSYTTGDLLYAASATTIGVIADVATGNALISGGAGADPSYGKIGLTTHISGTLAVGNGGTGATTLTGYLVGNGTAAFSTTATIPTSDLSGTISLTTQVSGTLGAGNGGTGISSYTVGDILYASGTTTLSSLADVATGNALISGGVSNAPLWGKIGLTTHVSGTLPVGNGGSGATTLTGYLKGNGTSAFTASATIPSGDITGAALTKADDTNVTLTLGGSPSTALLAATSITAGWSGQLAVSRGGTGNSTLASGYLLKGNGVSPTSASVIYDDGTNVGIGTATPTNSAGYSTLSLNGSTGGQLVFQTGGAYRQTIYSSSTDLNILNGQAGNLTFGTNNAERMRIDSAGNTSIGTTSALLAATGRGNLTINGATDAILTFGIAGAYSGYLYSGPTKVELDVQGSRSIQFNTNGNQRLVIDSGGSVVANIDMRAPIFYDSDNTAYYINGAGNSVLNTLYMRNGSIEAKFAQASNFGYSSSYRTVVLGNEYLTTISMGVDVSGNASGSFNGQGEGREVIFRNGVNFITPNSANNSYLTPLTLADGYAASTGSFRAPIFYDSNDTAFYADMAGTSNFNQINLGDSTKFIRGGGSGQTILGVGSVNDAYLQVGGSYYPIWNSGNFTPGNYLPLTGGTLSGTLTIQNSTDAQLYLNGNGTSWAGISWADVSGGDTMFYNGSTSTFAIGGGGSVVANKKLHINGGTTIGSGLAATAVATNGLLIEGALNAGNGTLTAAGTTFSNVLAGRGTNRVVAFDGNGTVPSVWWTNGGTAIGAIDAISGGGLAHWANNGSSWQQQMAVNYGNVTINTDIRSPIYYDSNNTTYYVDPASGSNLVGQVQINGGTTMSGGWNRALYLASQFPVIVMNSGSVKYSAIGVDYTEAQSGMVFWVNGNSADITNGSATIALRINTGNFIVANDVRATIFYDSNNTAFFVDPNSTSVLNTIRASRVQFSNSNPAIVLDNTSYQILYDPTGNAALYLGGADPANYYDNSTHYFRTRGGSNMAVMNSNGIQAPIFYDLANTGYYGDFAGTSNLFNLTISGGGNKYLQIQSTDGGEAMVRYLGATGPSWYVGKRTTSQLVDTASFHFYSESAGATVGGIDVSGNMFASTSFRAPIFYDSNNTGYYVDPASGTVLGGTVSILGGRNITLSTSGGNVQIKGDAGGWSNGLLFYGSSNTFRGGFGALGSGDGLSYLWAGNDYNNAALYLYASNYAESPGSFRAPIFYDSNNTAYYFDGASTSRWTTSNQDGFHTFNNYGLGIVGTYSSTRYQLVWALGDAYKGNADGTSLSGAYGLWFSYPSAGGPAANLSTHGLMLIQNGSFMASLDPSMRAVSDMRAPIFYDYDNTGYYTDPAGTSALNIVTFGSSPAGGGGGGRIIPSTGSPYSIRQEFGSDNSGWRYGIAKNVSGTVTIMFYVQDNGDCVATGNVTAYSDIRLKANIETIPSALDKLDQIRGVTYTRTDMDDKERRYAGVIAQEIEAVLPEAIGGDEDIKTVDYNATIGLLIQAVKELTDKVKALEAKEQ
jgi:hypothetical protein